MVKSKFKVVKCTYPEEFRKNHLCRYMKVDFTCDYETWRIENYHKEITKCAWMKVILADDEE